MASPKMRVELARTIGHIDFEREVDFYQTICDGLAPEFENSSAWTFSKEKDSMIDEYIVDTEEYLGIGSGAMSFLDGCVYHNTFSLKDYESRINSGRMSVVKAGKPYSRIGRMRYRFVTEFFGLRLDKQRFIADFGVPVERGLAAEMAFMRLSGSIASEDERYITLTDKGRYLLLVMMRETLSSSNDVRDQERTLLPEDEKMLLFDNQQPCGTAISVEECLAAS